MAKLWIDFETRSSRGIDDGTMPYLHTPQSAIVLMSWAWEQDPVRIWIPDKHRVPPFKIKSDTEVYAHNIQFDQRVWNILGRTKHFFPYLPIEQCVDVMALMGRYTFPQALDQASKVLKLKLGKMAISKKLMKKICMPPFDYTDAEMQEFIRYCVRDTQAMREAVSILPKDRLAPSEQQIWLDTVWVNRNGVPIDIKAVNAITGIIDLAISRELKELPELTAGYVTTIGQTKRMREILLDDGIETENFDIHTVNQLLEDHESAVQGTDQGGARALPYRSLRLCQLRKKFASAAVKKFRRIQRGYFKGRMYDNLRYHGAGTGRWAGLGFQFHNQPRDTVEDPDAEIQKYYDGTAINQDPVNTAKALIRPSVRAGKGKILGVADYSSIENVLLNYTAGQWDVVENFAKGIDEYTDFATQLYPGLRYEEVTKDQRTFCKPGVLGAGYGLGGFGLVGYAEGMGVHLTGEEATVIIKTYRQNRREVVKFWYKLKDNAIAAIRNPGLDFTYNNCTYKGVKDRTGRPWLVLRLPSGRNVFYCEPEVREDKYGLVPTRMAINSYNKQWQRMKMTPGLLTENVIQALARDLMAHGIRNLREAGFLVIGHVHDEIICELDEEGAEAKFDEMVRLMTSLPKWAKGLPLRAEGELLRRYKKL